MKLIVFVLNKTEKLNDFLISLSKNGLKGATIIKSTGLIRSLYDSNKEKKTQNLILDSLRIILNKTENENITIFSVVDEAEEKIFINLIHRIIGNIKKEDVGFLFTMPVCRVDGLF